MNGASFWIPPIPGDISQNNGTGLSILGVPSVLDEHKVVGFIEHATFLECASVHLRNFCRRVHVGVGVIGSLHRRPPPLCPPSVAVHFDDMFEILPIDLLEDVDVSCLWVFDSGILFIDVVGIVWASEEHCDGSISQVLWSISQRHSNGLIRVVKFPGHLHSPLETRGSRPLFLRLLR